MTPSFPVEGLIRRINSRSHRQSAVHAAVRVTYQEHPVHREDGKKGEDHEKVSRN